VTRRLLFTLSAALLAASTGGCSIVQDSIYGAGHSAGTSAGSTVGTEAGNRAGNSAVNSMGGPTQPVSTPAAGGYGAGYGGGGAMPPQAMMFYTQYIFTLAFSSGGYSVGNGNFTPGQYARFSLPSRNGDGKSGQIERAYLGDDSEGNQWWKVKFTDPKKGDTTILEALLSPKDNKMLRLRGKFPQDAEGKEMAVTENAAYTPPTRLSAKSIEGATKGVENVTVPAGSFSARHVVFGDAASTHEWWLSDQVPGGTVKQLSKGGSERNSFSLELLAFGGDAKTELGTQLK
jgi:hypothetical protein